MNDPERLADGHRSELVRTMLSAARDEGPSSAALQRTLSALGAGAAILSASSAAAGMAAAGSGGGGGATASAATLGATGVSAVASKIGQASLISTALKWIGVGAVSGLLAAGVADRVAGPRAPERTALEPAPQPVKTLATPIPRRAPEPVTHAPPAVLPEPERRPPPQVASKPSPQAADPRVPLAAEVLAVDRAREAVAAGQPERALSELNAYERRFGDRRLAPEALFLKMEAFAERGDQTAARATARQLLSIDPNGPHAARARAVLGSP